MPVYEVSYMWYSGVACFIVVIVGGIVSAIVNARGRKTKARPVNQALYAPVIETLLACWPKKLRTLLREKRLVSSRKMVTAEEMIGEEMTEDILRSFLEDDKGLSKGKGLDRSVVEAIAKRRRDAEAATRDEDELTEL